MKICTKCKRELPIEQFYYDKRSKSSRCCWCKGCWKEYNKQHPLYGKSYASAIMSKLQLTANDY